MAISPRTARLALAACSITAVCVALAFVAAEAFEVEEVAWAFVVVALLVAFWWQRDLELDGTALEGPSGPVSLERRIAGGVIAAAGAFVCFDGSSRLMQGWAKGFEQAWVSWFFGTALLGIGLDLFWARWTQARQTSRGKLALIVLAVVLVGALFRLGTFYFFPAPYHVTQVEELQVGAMGNEVLAGARHRWEYLSQAWLGALGIKLGGPTLMATRMPSTVISFLKIAALFLWLRFSVGTLGAVVGSLLLGMSVWDTTFARVSTNHNVLIVLGAFALLAGPCRRGRPSAYVWLGLLSGYVFYEYVLYRPLAVFAVIGAFLMSLRDQHAGVAARLARPLLTLALIAAMTLPLYQFLQLTGRSREFFDGIGRARANTAYYNPTDGWGEATMKRLHRAQLAASLFFFRGADSPMTNPQGKPLIDPFTSLLIVIGVAYAVAHPLRQLFGLTLLAALGTLVPALVVSGNFDFVRAGSALGYVYGLAGFGAASLAETLRRASPRWGLRVATVALTAGLLFAAQFSLRHLWSFVTDPMIERAQFRDLAYLTSWLKQHGEKDRVVVAAPNFSYLMEPHDAAWMRGKKTRGAAFWDIRGALSDLAAHPEPSVLMVYAGPTSADVQRYLKWLVPDLEFTREPGPIGPTKDLLYAYAPQTPASLVDRLARWNCLPVHSEVELLDLGGKQLASIIGAAGVIDAPVWPGEAQIAVMRERPELRRAQSRFDAAFRVETEGDYIFPVETYPGSYKLEIDGVAVPAQPTTAVHLAPGLHQFDLRTEYDPNASAPLVRVYWQGPDSVGKRELMPFYRISPERCAAPAA